MTGDGPPGRPAAGNVPPGRHATPGDGPGLTPELAVGYLRELSADIREAVILSPECEPLAGPPELAEAAARLLSAAPDAAEIEVAVAGGAIHAARGEHHAVVAVCGRYALPALIRYDLKVVLGELAAETGGGGAAPHTEAA